MRKERGREREEQRREGPVKSMNPWAHKVAILPLNILKVTTAF